MSLVSFPQKITYNQGENNVGTVTVLGCYPGYGTTIGNALRRVLLSSIEGSAVTAVKIKGVSHEFSAITGVQEDVLQIVLNLKKLNIAVHSEEPVRITLKKTGVGPVTIGDIDKNADFDVVDKDQVICNITDPKTTIDMELTAMQGMGYIPVEQQQREDIELGAIAIDAAYTPIRRVNFIVENMRVGKRTDYEKVTFEIQTNGSTTGEEAFTSAVDILRDQFNSLQNEEQPAVEAETDADEEVKEDDGKEA